jgi:hypothetical protein
VVALRQPGLAINAPNQRHPLSHDQGGHSIAAPPGRLHRRRGGQLLAALRLQVLPITPEIALLSSNDLFQPADPADRLIGATALQLGSRRSTADAKLLGLPELETPC